MGSKTPKLDHLLYQLLKQLINVPPNIKKSAKAKIAILTEDQKRHLYVILKDQNLTQEAILKNILEFNPHLKLDIKTIVRHQKMKDIQDTENLSGDSETANKTLLELENI